MVDLINSFTIDDFRVKTLGSIAEGGFANVWDAWHTRGRYGRVAIKILKVNRINNLKEELEKILSASRDHCTVPLFGYINEFRIESIQGIVSKFMPCGSLDQILHGTNNRNPIRIPKHLAYRILREISDAMHMMHTINLSQRLLHLDLKPSNILLDEDLHAKVIDFGAAVLATVTDQRSGSQPDNDIRTASYCAPEFFRPRQDQNNELRTSKYDVYSFSVMMWEILSGTKPFEGLTSLQIKLQVLNGNRPQIDLITSDIYGEQCQSLKDLMKAGWHAEIDQRPPFFDIREYFRRIQLDSSENEINDAVRTVKNHILNHLGQRNFNVRPEDYTINFRDALFRNQGSGDHLQNRAPVLPAPVDQSPGLVPAQDDLFSSSFQIQNNDRLVSENEILQLSNNLYYTDGLEVLALRLGLSMGEVDNINNDYGQLLQKKIRVFRTWVEKKRRRNQPPTVSSLIYCLREAKVAVDVWDFLDPERIIRTTVL